MKTPEQLDKAIIDKVIIYNQYPRCYRNGFADMTDHLSEIAALGFNCVWINPFNQTSNTTVVTRINEETGEKIEVRSSIYAMFDPSMVDQCFSISKNQKEKSIGNPSAFDQNDRDIIKNYTDTAMRNGLIPIFDLVMNHVAIDSPLVKGEFKYFNDKGINTKSWFQSPDPKWDDVMRFDYSDPVIRDEIFNNLWKPMLEKYVNEYEFRGARIDFATGFSREIQKTAYSYLAELIEKKFAFKSIIIFAECLPPKGLDKIVKDYREVGYTHVTNGIVFMHEGNKEWFMKDRGLKQQLIFLDKEGVVKAEARGGTVGFCGSHDEGPVRQVILHQKARKLILSDDLRRDDFEQAEMNNKEKAKHTIINEIAKLKISEQEMQILIRDKLATTALMSDGGWYLLAGDEFGSKANKSTFVQKNGAQIYNEAQEFEQIRTDRTNDFRDFIANINISIKDLPRNKFFNWVEKIEVPGKNNVIAFIRHNGEGYENKCDLIIVNLEPSKLIEITKEDILQIAEKSATNVNEDSKERARHSVIGSSIKLIGEIQKGSDLTQETKLYNAKIALQIDSSKISTKYNEHIQKKDPNNNQSNTNQGLGW